MKLSEIVCPECFGENMFSDPYEWENEPGEPAKHVDGCSWLVECTDCGHPWGFITEEEAHQ